MAQAADLKKKRQPNFSEFELMAMIAAVSDKQDTLFAKFDSNITVRTKSAAWQYVTEAVNQVSTVRREVHDVRKNSVILGRV